LIELISFLPYIVYEAAGYDGHEINPFGFVLFRVLRIFYLTSVFPSRLSNIEENLHLYTDSLKLAYVSYKTFGVFIIYITIYFSMLIYVFERGEWDSTENVWKRPGENEESPFANYYNCIYFSLVTGTTLGYGDMFPRSYVGKFISLITVIVGLINVTFLISVINDCFEEVFHRFLQNRIATIDNERSIFIRRNVAEAQSSLDKLQRRSRTRHKMGNSRNKTTIFSPKLDTFFLSGGNALLKS